MTHPLRRATIGALLSAVACASLAQPAARTDGAYPSKPVRWIVPFAPGAANDIIARLFARHLSERMGQQFVVENRGGAGGAIGAAAAANAAPDGYTLLLSNPGPNIATPLLTKDAQYGVSAFASVIAFGYVPLMVIAHPGFPAATPAELLAWLKANPGRANWGSSGNLGNTHIAFELFRAATGTQITHVPYKGSGPALADLLSGQIQLMHSSLASVEAHLKTGRLRVIAVANTARHPLLPDVPTLAEAGVTGAEAVTWFGMSVPAGTPREIVARLNAESNQVLRLADARTRLEALGLVTIGGPPEALDKLIERDAADMRKLIRNGVLKGG